MRPPKTKFNPQLWCHVRGFEPNLHTHETVVRILPGDAPDMSGCIVTCQKLDPDVRRILVVWENDEPDMLYTREPDGEWTAHMYRHST